MTIDNLRHAQYDSTGVQVDDPQALTSLIPLTGRLPYILAQSGMPVLLPSSGTSNATGLITHTTALVSMAVGQLFQIYLPAGVVVAGVAGVYLASYVSATQAQLVGNPATANAAYTTTTGTPLTLVSVTIPAGSMGPNGSIRIKANCTTLNSVGTKLFEARLGANVMSGVALAAHNGVNVLWDIQNQGTVNRQFGTGTYGSQSSIGAFTAGSSVSAVTTDTSIDQTLILTMNMSASATDCAVLSRYTVEILPAA